jgi:molybdopterin biosynthesis enzyme MoaB
VKEKYEEAKIEIIELRVADVITTSGGGGLAGGDFNVENEDSFAGGGIK